MIVEGDTGRDDVEHSGAVMGERAFEEGEQLPFVARKRAGGISGTGLDGQRTGINGGQVVDDSGLELGAGIRRGGELPLGEAILAVVLDDVNDGEVATHQMHELADADGGAVAIAT